MKLVGLLATFVLVVAACGDSAADTTTTTSPVGTTSAPATTQAPAPTTTLPGAVEGEWCNRGNSPDPAASTAGAGDRLLIFQWQAPSQANSLLSSGTKDQLAGSLVLEPLVEFNPGGEPVPVLAVEVPSLSNGGIAADLRTWCSRGSTAMTMPPVVRPIRQWR